MKRLIILLLAFFVVQLSAQPLEHRSWQFQSDNWEYLQKAIPMAKEMGMNRIQLSHEIIMDAEELWEGEKGKEPKLELVRNAISLAKSNGLKVDMWTHEFSGIPDKFVKDGVIKFQPELWEWLEQKYDRVFSLIPNLDGLVVTFAETDYEVYKGSKIEKQEQAVDNLVMLSEEMHKICLKHNKLLILRTFVHFPQELDWIGKAYRTVCENLKDSDNLLIMTKIIPHDWHPYYPYNPLLGAFPQVPQVVEFDLGNEYTGKNEVFYPMLDYIRRSLDYSLEKGVIGAVGRVERENNLAIGTLNEVNIYAFSKMLNDPTENPEKLWQEWCGMEFGKDATTYLMPAFKRLFDVTNITFFPYNQWIYRHSRFGNFAYTFKHLEKFDNYSIRRWIPSPYYGYAWDQKRYPTDDTFLKLVHEKELADKLLVYSFNDLEKAKPFLSNDDYAMLKYNFEVSQVTLDLHHQFSMIFYKTVRFLDLKERNINDDELEQLHNEIALYCKELKKINRIMEKKYADNIIESNNRKVDSICDEYMKLVKQEK